MNLKQVVEYHRKLLSRDSPVGAERVAAFEVKARERQKAVKRLPGKPSRAQAEWVIARNARVAAHLARRRSALLRDEPELTRLARRVPASSKRATTAGKPLGWAGKEEFHVERLASEVPDVRLRYAVIQRFIRALHAHPQTAEGQFKENQLRVALWQAVLAKRNPPRAVTERPRVDLPAEYREVDEGE